MGNSTGPPADDLHSPILTIEVVTFHSLHENQRTHDNPFDHLRYFLADSPDALKEMQIFDDGFLGTRANILVLSASIKNQENL